MTDRPRARDIGLPFDGTPGMQHAITDIAGITVRQRSIADITFNWLRLIWPTLVARYAGP